jgi:hypothetical protein
MFFLGEFGYLQGLVVFAGQGKYDYLCNAQERVLQPELVDA